ncbi:serine hydrolase domain-containing protein [Colwellia psychrerythraea]|uniref:Beta-lactamase n=1 Tax=Colwellia psychrerythraea TaxID=28229 RepID=A0A099KJB8_COLPS|nr:serine hydrolase domain-containing protein [Colwellia psychrerythraea]KGJ90350.1 beta-lactamase [Colwellia psychrerythraea]
MNKLISLLVFITLLVLLIVTSEILAKPEKVPNKESSRSNYSIPNELRSVNEGKNGFSAEQSRKYRQAYSGDTMVTAGNAGNYAASRLSENLPTAVVHRYGPVSELNYSLTPQIGDVSATTILGTMTLNEMMEDERSRFKAITVVHKGKIVFEKYIGIRDWDNHLWASATKILVGTLAHIASEQGQLDLDATVSKYLPELKGSVWENIKISDVLHQRSGLDVSESRLGSSPEHPVSLFYAIGFGDPSLPEGLSLMDALKRVKVKQKPGVQFEYASLNTYVVTLALEKVTGKPFEDLVTEYIWSKAGMEGDGVLGLTVNGEPSSPGAFAARLRDLARFGMLFTPSWSTITNTRVVSENYFDKAKLASKEALVGNDYMSKRLINDFAEDDFGASYQWDAVFADGDLYKSGRTGQALYVSPETDTVVVFYSSSYQAEVWVHAYAREIVKQTYRK